MARKISNEIKVLRAKKYKGTQFVDLEINGVKVYGCRLIDSKTGKFIGFPSYKGSDGKYYSHAYIELSEEEIEQIENDIKDME